MPVGVYALSDGSVMVATGGSPQPGRPVYSHLWRYDPATGTFTSADPPTGIAGAPARSGDGRYLLVPSVGGMDLYSTAVAGYVAHGSTNLASICANSDGSEFAASNGNGAVLLNGALQPIGQFSGTQNLVVGAPVFNAAGTKVYLSTAQRWYVLDASSATLLGYQNIQFAGEMDTVNLFGATPNLILAASVSALYAVSPAPPVTATEVLPLFSGAAYSANPNVGPAAGGTQVQFIPAPLGPTPADGIYPSEEAYFGLYPAVADSVAPYPSSSNQEPFLTAEAPPATPGPRTVVLTDAQGGTTVLPLAYTYGPKLLRIVPNTADPQGHSRVTIFAYGIGFFPSSGVSITIGGQPVAMSGAVWNTPTNLNFPEQSVTVPVPPGTPGWADVEVTTPSGSDTLHRGIQYLSRDLFVPSPAYTNVVYDSFNRLFYLTGNGGSIGVFDPSSASFGTPLAAAGVSSGAVLAGEALTPGGSDLLAADPQDDSVVVFSLASGASQSVSVRLPADPATTPSGVSAPQFVTAAADDRAFVSMVPCIPDPVRELDLSTLAVTARTDVATACTGPPGPLPYPVFGAATASGQNLLFASGVDPFGASPPATVWSYDAGTDTFAAPTAAPSISEPGGAALAADGGVQAAGATVLDANLQPLRPSPTPGGLVFPQLNATGSLLFYCGGSDQLQGGVSFVRVVAAQTGQTLLKLDIPASAASANDPIPGCAADGPLAVSASGDQIVVPLHAGGLVLFQLGAVPLAIGSVSPSTAPPGGTIQILGSGFDPAATATVDGHAAVCAAADAETLSCTLPASVAPGAATLTVTDPDGESATLSAAFTVN